MAWTSPYTFIVGEAPTAEVLNEMLRDNMNHQAPAKAMNAGAYFVSDGANSVAERSFRGSAVNMGFTLNFLNTWTTAGGPEVSVRHGGQLLAIYSARVYLDTVGGEVSASVSVVDQVGPSFDWAVRHSVTKDDLSRSMAFKLFTGLTPGTDTVRMMYHSENTPAYFHQRQLLVMPF